MKDSQDELKSVFHAAFEAEQIAFDPGAWDQMNAMLNRRQRRRLLGVWLSSGLFFGISTLSLLLLLNTQSPAYTPRNGMVSFMPMEREALQPQATTLAPESQPTGVEQELPLVASAKQTSAHNTPEPLHTTAQGPVRMMDQKTMDEPVASLPASNTLGTTIAPAAQEDGDEAEGTNHDTEGLSEDKSITPKEEVDIDAPAMVAASTNPSPEAEPSEEHDESPVPVDVPDQMAFMPVLDIALQAEPNTIAPEEHELTEPSKQHLLITYASASTTKTFNNQGFGGYSGWGQRVAAGLSYQLRGSWFISGEAAFARDLLSDTAQIKGPNTYGYTRSETFYTVHTSELLYLEAPVMIHHRFNRFWVGAGVSTGFLSGLKNETAVNLENDGTFINQGSETGYFRWNRYHSLRMSVLADVQYQIWHTAYAGIRPSYGLNDLLSATHRNVRTSRLEIYLKLTIR